MKLLDKYAPKNSPFLLGFGISLMGALPLGYINVISLQILLEQGNWATVSFISGIVFIEFFVLKAVSFGAKWLVEQKKLVLFIDVFTIVFFLVIAIYFITNIGNDKNFSLAQLQLAQFPFILGLLLNSLNFIQWPYWSGIYIYLFRTEKLDPHCNDNSLFIIGAMIGTLAGMLLFAHTLNYFLVENNIQMSTYLNPIFAILFLVLAIGQIGKLFLKKRKLKYSRTISIKENKINL
jgi:threonine/homoserine/homoserine lactone efflux protein